MMMRDVLDLVRKEKRRRKRVKAVQKLAVGMSFVAAVGGATGVIFALKSGKELREDLKKRAVNAVETIKDTVQKMEEAVKASVANPAQEAQEAPNVMAYVHEKTEGVERMGNDINDGHHKITQDIHITAENISDEIKDLY